MRLGHGGVADVPEDGKTTWGGTMRAVWTLACVIYGAVLTVLLLAPSPAHVVGLRHIPEFPWGDVGIHFTAFTLLALLVHTSRWPGQLLGRSVFLLIGYGIVTESLQWFVPSRAVELKDYVENILGVLVGSGVYWMIHRAIPHREARRPVSLAAQLVRHAAMAQTAAD